MKRDDGTHEILISQEHFQADDSENPHPDQNSIVDFFAEEGFGQTEVCYQYENLEFGIAINDARPRISFKRQKGIEAC